MKNRKHCGFFIVQINLMHGSLRHNRTANTPCPRHLDVRGIQRGRSLYAERLWPVKNRDLGHDNRLFARALVAFGARLGGLGLDVGKNYKMEINTNIIFPGQQPNEQVHLVFRQHWAVLFAKLSLWFILAVLYLAIDYANLAIAPQYLSSAYLPYLELLEVVYLTFLGLGLFIIVTLWYLNFHVITNERVVDIEQKSLLHHTISELHLEQVQDVTAEVHGLPENILNYGDVYVQTAGETQRFVFHKIPNPTKVTQLLIDLYEQLPDDQKHSRNLTPRNTNRSQ
jgi:hypothetical protein